MSSTPEPHRAGEPARLRLYGWTDRPIVAVALVAVASGFGQYGASAALGDVAKGFGRVVPGATIADQVGLSGTELGLGLAIIRLASLGALPIAGIADRLGRRTVLLATVAIGLALTVLAAASPGYWWFVVLFALGRPLLSATNALSQVSAAEQTSSHDRAKAVALVAAGYSLGAGLTAVIHSLAHSALGFRGLFALSVVPLALLWFVRGSVTEPDRFAVAEASTEHPLPVLGAVGPNFRRRLGIVALLGFAVAVITGPANTFIFLYAENVVHLSGALTAAMVVASGVVGLGGLVVGRWLADNVGRRPTAALGMVAVALSGVVAYSGSSGALVLGYIFGVVSGAVLAPALGALVNELFPTSIRASVAGWLVAAGVAGAVVGLLAFGAVADIRNRWGLAAVIVFLPAAAAAGLFWSVPETRGREPEQLWPDTA